jgi:DNA polymerase-3 subunit delta'
MQFNKIKGLTKVKEVLARGAATDNVAHALLFAGKQGAPVIPMALAYATFLNCENRLEHDSCGVCSSCIKNSKFIHPDLHFVYPVSSTKKVTKKEEIKSTTFIKEWRSFLGENLYNDVEEWSNYFGSNKQVQISRQESREIIKNLSLKPFEGKYKIMMIWLPELMHPASANGILKILEEPPSDTIFILMTHQEDKLLSTIISRTQRFYIPLFSDEELVNILHEDYQVPQEQARQLAHLSDGSLHEALRLSQQTVNDHQQMFIEWMRECYKNNFPALVSRADEFHMLNKLAQKSFLQYALNMVRETLLLNAQANELNRSSGEAMAFIENFSKALTPEKAEKVIQLINEGYQHVERNASAKIMFLDLSIMIAKQIK